MNEDVGTAEREVERVAAKRYWRERDAQVIVDACRASGEATATFAERIGVEARRIERWSRRLAGQVEGFYSVTVVGDVSKDERAWAAEVVRGAWTVRVPSGFGSDDIGRLLRVLTEVEAW